MIYGPTEQDQYIDTHKLDPGMVMPFMDCVIPTSIGNAGMWSWLDWENPMQCACADMIGV